LYSANLAYYLPGRHKYPPADCTGEAEAVVTGLALLPNGVVRLTGQEIINLLVLVQLLLRQCQ
jgi:hypothetical protein